jgi:hypothetical protein
MSVDPAPKIFIQNKLAKCRGKLQELGPLISAKRMCLSLYASMEPTGSLMASAQARKLTNMPNLSPHTQVTDHSEILTTLRM